MTKFYSIFPTKFHWNFSRILVKFHSLFHLGAIKNVIGSEGILMHKTENSSNNFSNSFTHYQAEEIKKRVICVQILLEIHQTEHS